MKQVNVHVYERSGMGYKRISAFDVPVNTESRPIIRVLYCGGVHYDALAAISWYLHVQYTRMNVTFTWQKNAAVIRSIHPTLLMITFC
eukprot:gene21989-27271_t